MTPETEINRYLALLTSTLEAIQPQEVIAVAHTLRQVCQSGGTVWVCGNGGSASTASHMACDLSKNVTNATDRRLRVVSLTDNMAHFSAIANDLDYAQVFVEQLRNVMTPKDALVAISASGNSPNVVNAARFAIEQGVPVVGMTGFSGGDLRTLSSHSLHVNCDDYGPVEDLHLVLNHLLVVSLRLIVSEN